MPLSILQRSWPMRTDATKAPEHRRGDQESTLSSDVRTCPFLLPGEIFTVLVGHEVENVHAYVFILFLLRRLRLLFFVGLSRCDKESNESDI